MTTSIRCFDCGHPNARGQKFCGECGRALDAGPAPLIPAERGYTPMHLADRVLRSRSALEGERKPVTVLFCDIVESTHLAERLGAERMHKLLSAFFESALAEVHRFEGTINQFLGDGFMALFGAPLTHEDHARRAALAALAIRGLTEGAAASDGSPRLRLRMGIHSGSVVVGRIGDNLRMDYTAVGDTTNVAARLQHEAEPGAILVSDAVRRALEDHAEFVALGERQLKGKAAPLVVHALVRARAAHDAATRRGGAPLVGRGPEIAALHGRIDAVQAKTGGIVVLIGEAGLGKSRLFDEARRHARGRTVRWAEGQCLSFGRTLSHWPFREAFRSCFEMTDLDDGEVAFAKMRQGVERLFGDASDELLPYVGALLALTLPDAMERQIRALDALAVGHQISRAALRLVERLAIERPLVLAFEDWHWADASSADLLLHLLPLAERAPVLFLVACRPEAQGAADALRRAIAAPDRGPATAIALPLRGLPADDSTRLIESLLGPGEVPAIVRDMLLARSRGNPFYLGELLRALVGTHGIERNALTGDWETTERYEAVPLPDTIEGVILARIDRLEDEVKQTLKAAAVVGRSFFYRILEAITTGQSTLDRDLAKLCRAELIDEKPQALEVEYAFRHPLIQQATYDSMVEDRRRHLHRQVAVCLEDLFAARLEHFHSMLAYHFAKAEDWPRAQHYLYLAAEHADRLAADEEALELYDAVISIAQHRTAAGLDPLRRAQLDAKIGDAHFRAGRHEPALAQFGMTLKRLGQRVPRTRWFLGTAVAAGLGGYVMRPFWPAPASAQAVPMPPAVALCCEVLESSALIHFFTDPLHSVYDSLRLASLSRRHPGSRAHIFSLSLIAMTFTALGLYRSADWCLRRAGGLADAHGEDWQRAMVDHFRALLRYHTGAWAEAVRLAGGASERCWKAGNIRLWTAVVGNEVTYLYSLGDPRWLASVDHIWSVVSETSDRQAQAWALTGLAMAQEHRGEFVAALATLQKAIAIYTGIPDPRLLAHAHGLEVSNLSKLDRIGEADAAAREALQLIRRHRLSGSWNTRPLLAIAELRLLQLERGVPAARAAAAAAAGRAVQDMRRQGRRVCDEGAVEAYRLDGTLAWLLGDRARADTQWQAGLAAARRLGGRHVEARLYFARGAHRRVAADLRRAEAGFDACGATCERRAAEALRTGLDMAAEPAGG